MSDTIATASLSGGTPKVSRINEAVIRIAGNSQDGIQVIGGFLARLAGRSEQEVMTFMTIPATISGGPSIFQVRIGSGEVLSAGDDADMLLATTSVRLKKAASCFLIPITLNRSPNGSRTIITSAFRLPR
jgi:2-oxoglutarate ferredoxin oxidoreductase subunit alpha